MRNVSFAWPLVLGTVVFSTVTRAEDQSDTTPDESEPSILTEIVITASRYEEGVETVPANVSVISEEDIARSTAKDIPGILQKEVGLHVYDITGNRRSFRVDRSGFGETAALNTLVLVDGRRLNNPDLSGADWMLIPLARVKRIEVIRGSRGSVLYGDNASDSVINIITKIGDEAFTAGVAGATGSYDTFSTNAYLSGTQNDLSYALSGSYSDSDGYRDNSDTDPRDIGLNLDYFIEDRAKVSFSSGYHKDKTGLPGALRLSESEAGISRKSSTHPDDFTQTEDYYFQLNPEMFVLRDSNVKTPLSYRKRKQRFFSTFAGGEFKGDTQIKTVSASPQFVMQEPVGGFDNNLTLGLDYFSFDEDITNESLFFGSVDIGRFDLEKKNYGLYFHEEFYPVRRLALSAGYRYDKVKYDFSPTAPGTQDHRDFDENLFTAGVNYKFYKDSYLYFSFSDGFRYPVLDELFNFFNNTINTDLKPQTSDNYEIGIRHAFTKNLFANVNFFRVETKDEIFFNPLTFANENLDVKTRRGGIELALGFDADAVTLGGTYTYRDTKIRGGRFSGNKVPNVPRHQATIDVVWRPFDRLSMTLNGVYVGKRFLESDFANAFEKQDNYTVVNLKLNYIWQKITAFVNLNNVFDKNYEAYGVLSTAPVEPAFYPSPEINFLAGIRFDY